MKYSINDESKLRSIEEIQKAHDLLVAINLGEIPNPFPEYENDLHVSTDVLCWVLHHDHNESFKNNLDTIINLYGEKFKQRPEK